MHSTTSVAVPTVQHTTETPAIATPAHSTTTGKLTANYNGPQCAHCGWRGGGHADNCPFK
ncbi:hypothetical protein C8J57DRAFT_1514134 [Mycena rebaudengoi]|nr:hypothetical protein C8J57DRAFT_1514134 [Mycena rebaudengoi]